MARTKSLIGKRRVSFGLNLNEEDRAALDAIGIMTADGLSGKAASLFSGFLTRSLEAYREGQAERELQEAVEAEEAAEEALEKARARRAELATTAPPGDELK